MPSGSSSRRGPASLMKKQVHVFYSGRVHGVGFRLTAEEIAQPLGVVGWVRNLRDGRVELVAEADEPTLKRFLEALRTGPMKNFIQRIEASWSSGTDAFDDFVIRYL